MFVLQDFETELMAQASKQQEDMEEDKRGWERVEIEAERFVPFCLLFINFIGYVKEYIMGIFWNCCANLVDGNIITSTF